MAAQNDNTLKDPGFVVLSLLLRIHGVDAASEQILSRYGTATIGIKEMLHCAKALGLRASFRTTNWKQLADMPLPGIAALRDGGFLILGKIAEDRALVGRPSSRQLELISRAAFEAVWDGRLVLVAPGVRMRD